MHSSGVLSLTRPPPAFSHEALFYADRHEFLAGTGAFVRDGLMADEPVLVVLSASKNEALRSEVGVESERVEFADMGDVGSDPARIVPAWRAFVDQHRSCGRRLRGIGEPICADRSQAELVECQRHESLLNLAFAETAGFRLLCPYDTSVLDDEILAEARRSHPFLVTNGVKRESTEYEACTR